MRIIFLVSIIGLTTSLFAQVEVTPPTGWIELETPSELPPEIRYLKKVASEDQSIQVSVVALKPVNSYAGADEVVAGQIAGMKKGGFTLENLEDLEIRGFPAKHIVGEFRSDQYEGAFLSDTKIIFSDEATVSISVSIDEARGGREQADAVIDWISISGSAAALSNERSSPSANYSIGERIGRYAVYAAVGAAIIGVVRRRAQINKSKKANKAQMATPRKPSDQI